MADYWCMLCDGRAPAMLTCTECGATGRMTKEQWRSAFKRLYRQRSLEERRRIWKAVGGETELTPKSRIWPRKLPNGLWDL